MKSRNFNIKKIILYILFFVFLIVFLFSACYFIKYYKDEKHTYEQLTIIESITDVNEIDNENNQQIVESITDNSNPYYDYTKINLVDVNFDELKKINSDVKGWLVVNGTKINYPFVQASDNIYYLKHSFDKSANKAGWVYADYRNKLDGTDKNTIIYAHNMNNKTMFGTLKNILSNGWLNNIENYAIKISTEHENTLWRVFSVYHIPTTSDYIKTNFNNNEEFKIFADLILNRSLYNFNTELSENDRILTLSTCYSKTQRLVLHAKLIKRDAK